MNIWPFRKKASSSLKEGEKTPVLRHVAFIMDGNGRWAKKRHLPREFGHKKGAKNFQNIIDHCAKIGIRYVTVYAFSTENWRRPQKEIDAIMSLLSEYLDMVETDSKTKDIQFVFLGDKTPLPEELRGRMQKVEEETRGRKFMLNIAINYGGRDDILHACNKLLEAGKQKVSEEDFSRALYTAHAPNPDLVIRTGGDCRISNFLLWESAYAEYYFTATLWPDFSSKELDQTINAFSARHRRYGGL